jgi:hypothetical protein
MARVGQMCLTSFFPSLVKMFMQWDGCETMCTYVYILLQYILRKKNINCTRYNNLSFALKKIEVLSFYLIRR